MNHPEDEARDELAKMRALFDQGREAVKELAKLVGAYYTALVAEGLAPDAAMALAQNYQVMFMAQAQQAFQQPTDEQPDGGS